MGRLRRTISKWDSVPRDGTPFHTLGIVRFNPLAERFEGLSIAEDGKRCWLPRHFAEEPTLWTRLVPSPVELPKSFAFTVSYSVRPKTLRERLFDKVFGWLRVPDVESLMLHWRATELCASRSGHTPAAGASS